MNRRFFLRALALAGAGAVMDPERLLWVPKPIITVPALPATMGTRGSVLSVSSLTLADWARRLDPELKCAEIVKLLEQSNELLKDHCFYQGDSR